MATPVLSSFPAVQLPFQERFVFPNETPPAAADAAAVLRDVEEMARAYEQGSQVDALAAWIAARLDEAKAHKAAKGVDSQIALGLRVARKEYSDEELALMGEDDPKIFSSVTDTKIRGGRSWLLDILTNVRDKPYTVTPTPIPELPPAAEDAIVEQLASELQQMTAPPAPPAPGAVPSAPPEPAAAASMAMEPDGSFTSDFRERAAKLKALALDRARALAGEAAKRIEQRVHDRLLEAGWRTAFEAFATDIFMYPSAIMKGPYRTSIKKLRWKDGSLQAVRTQGYQIKRVPPDRFYPAPDAADVNTCPYVIEVVPSSASDLLDAKEIDGVDAAAVDRVLADASLGSIGVTATGPNLAVPLQSAQTAATAVYEVIVYTGRLPADQLAQLNISAGLGEQPEVEVWVCNGVVLRGVRNPNLLGRRPYYVASFAPTPGSLWGRGLPPILDDVQRVCNACMRALAKNMSYSSGPIGEYDSQRLEGEEDVAVIRPGRMYRTSNDTFSPSRSPALRFQIVPSAAPQLLNVHAAFLKLADDVSGIPAYVLGAPQASGAGRTLGGLSLLMGNAAKGLKAVVGHIDVNVIEPMVTDCYMAMMMDGDVSDADKVDVDVVARGSSGLLQEELNKNRAVETLQLLTPYADRGAIPKTGVQYMLRRVVSGLGFDPDQVCPDPGVNAQLRAAVGNASGSVSDAPSSVREGTPPPPLDRRSAALPDPVDQVRVQPGAMA